MIDQNNFIEENKGIKLNPLNNVKSCIEDKISPDTESDYKENYNYKDGPELLKDFVEQSCDRASIATARGSGTEDINWGRCVLWTVANMSTTGVPHSLNIRFTTSGWRLHSVVMGWFGRDNRSAITLRQLGMCLARRVMS